MTQDPAAQTRDARDGLIVKEDAARVAAALEKLPERYREAVVLYYRGDQSIAEVASVLGISEASARQRVHRGRTRLRDLLEPVEATLRATRPTAAFTAACVAAWSIGKSVPAAAAARPGSSPWVVPTVAIGVIASLAVIGVATGVLSSSGSDANPRAPIVSSKAIDPRAGLRSRFPSSARTYRPAALPPGAFAVTAPGGAPSTSAAPSSSGANPIDLEFRGAPMTGMLHLLSDALDTPIWLTFATDARIDITAHGRPALDALDDVLAQTHASRAEVAAVRIVAGGRVDASILGGSQMSLSVRNTPLNYVLTMIEPKLAMPIGRVGMEIPPTGPNTILTDEDGAPVIDESPPVTLDLHDVSAGAALEQALTQAGLGYELTTGLIIVPD